ncbi:hypothetical protein ACFQ2B_31650 [Streptomyces stramineus]
MCGIVATFSARGGVTERTLAGAMDRLRPRGPDGEGTWCSPGATPRWATPGWP